jgi:uncharacterized membrane protein
LPFCHVRLSARKPKPEAYPAALLTYGDHLRAKRLDLGLLQKQAAERIGVDETSVYNWESNRVQPAVRFIAGIIRFLSNPDGSTTVNIRLSYNPAIGGVGHIVASLFGADPKSQMDEDLVRMKSFIETGKVPSDAARQHA